MLPNVWEELNKQAHTEEIALFYTTDAKLGPFFLFSLVLLSVASHRLINGSPKTWKACCANWGMATSFVFVVLLVTCWKPSLAFTVLPAVLLFGFIWSDKKESS